MTTTQEKRIVRMKDLGFVTYNNSKPQRETLMNALTDFDRNPALQNVILDIGDVPLDEGAFNKFLIRLVSETQLHVIDESYDYIPQTKKITFYDERKKEIVTEEMTYQPYPIEIQEDYEHLNLTEEEFNNQFKHYQGAGSHFTEGKINGELTLIKKYSPGEYFQREVPKKAVKFTKREDLLKTVVRIRDGELDAIPLSEFIKDAEGDNDGFHAFDSESFKKAYDYLREEITKDPSQRIMIKYGNTATNAESAVNIARLLLLLNEYVELSDKSSGIKFTQEIVNSRLMQIIYDFTNYSTLEKDFEDRVRVGDKFMIYHKGKYNRVELKDVAKIERETKGKFRTTFVFKNMLTKYEQQAYIDKGLELPQRIQDRIDEDLVIDLFQVFGLNFILLPFGILEGTSEGLGDFNLRKKHLGRTEFRNYEEAKHIVGINPYMSGGVNFNSETDYTKIYRSALAEIYFENGWGELPEVDLEQIIRSGKSPFMKLN